MGMCLAKPQAEEQKSIDRSQITASALPTLTAPLAPTSTTPLKACLSTAIFHTASKAPTIFASTYNLCNGLLLAALVQGHGPSATKAAAFFHNNLLSVYKDVSQGEQPATAVLKTVLQKLHTLSINKGGKLFTHSGSSATLVIVNLETLVCTVANLGDVQCELTTVSGSFNSKRPCTQRLSTLHTLENFAEKARHQRYYNTTTGQYHGTTANDNDMSSDSNRVTRMLGMTIARSSTLPSHYCEPSVYETTLQPSNLSIILSSSSAWCYLSPAEAAYKTHLYDQMMMNQTPEAVAISPAVVDNTAKHLLHHVISKAAERYGSSNNQPLFSVQDVLSLPVERPVVVVVGGAGRDDDDEVYMPATPTTSSRQNKHLQLHRLCVQPTLKEVLPLGDLGIVVISLRSHRNTNSMPSPFAASSPYSQDVMSVLARRRWMLLKNHVEYLRLHRRECLLRWHETVHHAMKKGRAQAKAYEDQIKWHCKELVKVTPSLKVVKRDGTVVGIEAYRGGIDM